MWYSKKITKGWPVGKLNMEDIPSAYMKTRGQLKKNEKDVGKVKDRNDNLYREIHDLAAKYNAKVSVFKQDNKVYYTINGMGISVCLVNS